MTERGDRLVAQARNYMGAIDSQDAAAVCAHFAGDAELVVQTGGITVRGIGEIHALWASFFETHESMAHRVTNTVADPVARKVATEQAFRGVLHDGTIEERTSAYFFEFDERDVFTRVIVWIDGETPEHSESTPQTERVDSR